MHFHCTLGRERSCPESPGEEDRAEEQYACAGFYIEGNAHAGGDEHGTGRAGEPGVRGNPWNHRNHDRVDGGRKGLQRHVGADEVLIAKRDDRAAHQRFDRGPLPSRYGARRIGWSGERMRRCFIPRQRPHEALSDL